LLWQLDSARRPVELTFHEAAPGLFLSRFTADRSETLRFHLADADRPDHRLRLVLAAESDRSPELQVDPDHALQLARASTATGGRFMGLGSSPEMTGFTGQTGGGQRPLALRDFAPWALLLALLTLLLEILWRRLPSRPQTSSI